MQFFLYTGRHTVCWTNLKRSKTFAFFGSTCHHKLTKAWINPRICYTCFSKISSANGALISLQLAYIICKIWKSEKNTPFTLTELTVCTVDSLLCYLHCMSERKEKMQLYQYLHARSQRCCHCCVKHYIPPSPHFWCVFYANEKPHFLLVASYANCECEMFWLWGEKSSFFPPRRRKKTKQNKN